jgi:eukaryotic-like serine/threonine-protein kinase
MAPNTKGDAASERGLLARRYRAGRRLGKGGMGAVYEAQDTRLADHVVAIKENSNTAADAQEQFKREAVILARLQHPNLPKVTDYFVEPSGQQYLVMDYVPGEDLEHIIRRNGPLGEEEALHCMAQVLSAVHYLHTRSDPATGHKQPVVHRDIKPSNIKRTEDGRYVLVDFGISKLGTVTGTLPSMRAMTPGFAPIEQYDGGTDERSDIYSLGATLYAIVTLHIPPSATERSRRHAALAPPRKYNSKLSSRCEQVIERAMRIEPDDRYQSAADMYEDLIGRPITAGSDIIPAARRHKWAALWLALAGLLLVMAAILIFVPSAAPDSQPTPAAPAVASGDKGNGAGSRPPDSTEPALSGGTTPSTALAVVAIAASPTPASTLQEAETADVAAATVTLTATPSFTPAATAALSPTPAASSTARPTKVSVKPTSTPIPTITPSPTGTPTVTRMPAPTPPAAASVPSASGGGPAYVVLLEPPENTNTNSPTVFAWKPDAPLAEGQVYEVAFWKLGETEASGQSWTASGTSTSQVINPGGRIGSYRWGVWLGQFDAAGKYERVRFLGGDRKFDVSSGSSNSRDGGSNDNPGGDGDSPLKGG